jgi:hypothetical protein
MKKAPFGARKGDALYGQLWTLAFFLLGCAFAIFAAVIFAIFHASFLFATFLAGILFHGFAVVAHIDSPPLFCEQSTFFQKKSQLMSLLCFLDLFYII